MKTRKTFNCFKTLIVCCAIIGSGIVNNSLIAQERGFGITLKNTCSGSGLGSVISPQLSFRNTAHEITLGINVQKKHLNAAGIRAGYNYILNPGHDNEVFLFYDVTYDNNAWLSNRTVKSESFMRPENSAYYKSVRLNVLEQHVGFGVTFFKRGPVSFFGAIGAGLYNTLGFKQKNLFRERDLHDASVQLNLGLNFRIIPTN